jgi:RimJ/RimL family protein N-acetyltransferase
MKRLTPEQTATLKPWFLPERPGPLIGLHIIQTGHGICLVDRWPAPQAVLVESAGHYTLLGDAEVLAPEDVQPHIKGFVETSEAFLPLLKAAFPDLRVWQRVVFEQPAAPNLDMAGDYVVRRLEPSDCYHLQGPSEMAWISKTWGGPAGLTTSGLGWGAFVAGQLASVACTFFLGERYEEVGVVTEPAFRGSRLSTACVKALCRDIHARGHTPGWSTSPDNTASVRLAEKLGFAFHRHDRLYVVGVPIPEPA